MDIHAFTKSTCKELGIPEVKIVIAQHEHLGEYNAGADTLGRFVLITPKLHAIMTEDELCSIVTHELGHIYNHHGMKRSLGDAGRLVLSGVNFFLPLPIWKKILIELGLTVAELAAKRHFFHQQELEADDLTFRFGLNHAFASALTKMEEKNKASRSSNWLLNMMGTITHPDTQVRIDRLTKTINAR